MVHEAHPPSRIKCMDQLRPCFPWFSFILKEILGFLIDLLSLTFLSQKWVLMSNWEQICWGALISPIPLSLLLPLESLLLCPPNSSPPTSAALAVGVGGGKKASLLLLCLSATLSLGLGLRLGLGLALDCLVFPLWSLAWCCWGALHWS
jgi:hypothetical protein